MIQYHTTPNWPYKISAGGVIYTVESGVWKYVLLTRDESEAGLGVTYHLPKGTMEPGETLEQTALREIREESGYDTELQAYLGATLSEFTHPKSAQVINRTVHYFLGRISGGSPATMDKEHSGQELVVAEEAIRKLAPSPKQEANILQRAEQWFELNPATK